MKTRIGLLIMILALLMGASAGAENCSVIRKEGMLALECVGFTDSKVHAMELTKGERLEIHANCTGGAFEVLIVGAQGESLYAGTGLEAPGFSVEIPESGIVRLLVTGQNATGSLRIALKTERAEVLIAPETGLSRVLGRYGYVIAYDPAAFAFEANADMDVLVGKSEKNAQQALIRLFREEQSLDAASLMLLGEQWEESAELSPSIINWRAARTFQQVATSGGETVVVLRVLIETLPEEVFCVAAVYPISIEADFLLAFSNMLNSLEIME